MYRNNEMIYGSVNSSGISHAPAPLSAVGMIPAFRYTHRRLLLISGLFFPLILTPEGHP
jgi:hypothetical protein